MALLVFRRTIREPSGGTWLSTLFRKTSAACDQRISWAVTTSVHTRACASSAARVSLEQIGDDVPIRNRVVVNIGVPASRSECPAAHRTAPSDGAVRAAPRAKKVVIHRRHTRRPRRPPRLLGLLQLVPIVLNEQRISGDRARCGEDSGPLEHRSLGRLKVQEPQRRTALVLDGYPRHPSMPRDDRFEGDLFSPCELGQWSRLLCRKPVAEGSRGQRLQVFGAF